MNELINSKNLLSEVYKYTHPTYEVTDQDIDRMNNIIVSKFANAYNQGSYPNRVKISDELDHDGFPVYGNMAELLYSNAEKSLALSCTIDKMLLDGGFYTKSIYNKGLYLYITNDETNK